MATHNIKPGKHIMFSYGWDTQKIILQIHHFLTEKKCSSMDGQRRWNKRLLD